MRDYCSKLCAAAGEPIEGTAPERTGVVLHPLSKVNWHQPTQHVSSFVDVGTRPLLLAFRPLQALCSNSFEIESYQRPCDLGFDAALTLDLAICVDGKKDACCAKFAFSLLNELAAVKERLRKRTGVELRVFEASHLGGCRFAPTFVFCRSGNVYGRVTSGKVAELIEAEIEGRIIDGLYRGSIYASEPECWIRPLMQREGLDVPWLSVVESSAAGDGAEFRLKAPTIKLHIKLTKKLVEFPLISGCANIDDSRTIERSVYALSWVTELFS